MIRNLELERALANDIVDPEATINLMTTTLDLYCDRLISDTRQQIVHPDMIEMQMEAVITEAILDANPHLLDKFDVEFTRENESPYSMSIKIKKSVVQEHLELVSGSMLCH